MNNSAGNLELDSKKSRERDNERKIKRNGLKGVNNMRLASRNYVLGDEKQIANLFKLSFGKELNIEFWRWRYIENPFGKSVIMLMFDGEILVGHYAIIRIPVLIDGKETKAAFSMTTMTHPEYRGMGIFPKLAKDVYAECGKSGCELVFGFPNENSYGSFCKKLDWVGFGKVPAWICKNMEKEEHQNDLTEVKFYFKSVGYFDKKFDKLWDIAKPDCRFVVPRTSEFLNWRFLQKPGKEYHIVALYNKNKHLLGYAVYKIYDAEDEKRGHIIDFLFAPGNAVEEEIIDYGVAYFMREGVDNISCWVPSICKMEDILSERGFKRIEWPTYFGLKYLETYKGEKDISSFEELYITMGDSDVF